MKQRKWAIWAIIFVMAAAMLSGCGSSKADKMEALAGTWSSSTKVESESVREILESLDFYEEEIQLIDLTSMRYVHNLTFTPEQTYEFSYDVVGTKSGVYAFFSQAFHDMYENRTALNDTYLVDFGSMSEAEFQQYYADLYEAGTFSALISGFVEESFFYDQMGVYDSGKFDIVGNKIDFETSSAGEVGQSSYEINGETLAIAFAEGKITYTRQN